MMAKYVLTTFSTLLMTLGIGSVKGKYGLLVGDKVIEFALGSIYCALDEQAYEFGRSMIEFHG